MAEIYGSYTQLETARDKVKTYLDALITAMATGYTPKLDYAHDRHQVAAIKLNAVTVQVESARRMQPGGEQSGGSMVPIYDYLIDLSIRVHTAYEGRFNDVEKNARLLNSIDNYLSARWNMGDDYYLHNISDIKPNESFSESNTLGGSLMITMIIQIDHTQV
jgi:hypothetical protein